MRLIDADALKDGYMNMGYDPNEHPEESYMEGWCKGFNTAVDHCIGHVIYAPTIEPERKKGKWISIQAAEDVVDFECGEWRGLAKTIIDKLEALPSEQPESLTDKEKRIFLAAMSREEKVCKEVDRNHVREPYEDSLMSVCREIKRKVKGALWT